MKYFSPPSDIIVAVRTSALLTDGAERHAVRGAGGRAVGGLAAEHEARGRGLRHPGEVDGLYGGGEGEGQQPAHNHPALCAPCHSGLGRGRGADSFISFLLS